MAKERPSAPVSLKTSDVSKMSKVERLKAESQGLFWVAGRERHSFASEIDAMTRGEAETIGGEAKELSKYFGIYKQQERIEGRKSGEYIFMLRLKVPGGGEFSPEQWAALDAASERFADGTLRITTRQGVQFHHVRGKNLGALVRHLSAEYEHRGYEMSTLGACGDVNRNTMCAPADDLDPELPLQSRELAFAIAAELAPRAGASAYYQIFLEDDETKRLAPVTTEEPIYGAQYLPRKFKVAIAHPRDNSVDLLTQDVGLMPVMNGASAEHYDLYTALRLRSPSWSRRRPESTGRPYMASSSLPAWRCQPSQKRLAGSGCGSASTRSMPKRPRSSRLTTSSPRRRMVYFQRAWRRSLRSPFSFCSSAIAVTVSTTCARGMRPR